MLQRLRGNGLTDRLGNEYGAEFLALRKHGVGESSIRSLIDVMSDLKLDVGMGKSYEILYLMPNHWQACDGLRILLDGPCHFFANCYHRDTAR